MFTSEVYCGKKSLRQHKESNLLEENSGPELEIRKSKHRYADTKYRSKVQFMYSKVREMTQAKTTKDALLNDALKFIMRKEKEISKRIGDKSFLDCKKNFLRFLSHEETIWKHEKNVEKWWNDVEDSIDLKYSSEKYVFDENDGFDKLCRVHDEEWANQISEHHSPFDCMSLLNEQRKKQLPIQTGTTNSVICDKNIPAVQSFFQNVPVYIPNSLYYPNSLGLKESEGPYQSKAHNEIVITDLGFFAFDKPMDLCEYRIPSNAGLHDSTLVSSTLISL